jgi:hypothetical protein
MNPDPGALQSVRAPRVFGWPFDECTLGSLDWVCELPSEELEAELEDTVDLH